MKLKYTAGMTVLFCITMTSQVLAQKNPVPDASQQIRAAVSAAPEGMQKDAKVLGYTRDGKLTTLRDGTGELICLADDPADSRFHVACYFRELEPFMKRGRELRAEGKSRNEVYEVRKAEIKAGKLEFPDKPMALYSLSGPADGYDYEKGVLLKANTLRVVYVPYATVESTGITDSPTGPGAPWLMDAGKPWAHIMMPGGPVGNKSGNDD